MIRCHNKAFIIDYLRKEDEISNLNIIGVLENVGGTIFNNPADGVEIYVDDINNPNGVIVREHEYWYYVYAKNDEFIDLINEDHFKKNSDFGISACDEKVFKVISRGRKTEWEEPCILLYLDKDDFVDYEHKLELRSGTVDDAKIMDDNYTFRDEYSHLFIRDDLENRPSSVYGVDGEAVAWVLIHRDNSIGIMYTKKEYRGKNIAYELSMDLLKKVLDNNKIPFIHVGIKNEASFKLAEKCNFKKHKPVFWFGISDEK